MNNDIQSLLAMLREILGRDVKPGDMRPAPGSLMGSGNKPLAVSPSESQFATEAISGLRKPGMMDSSIGKTPPGWPNAQLQDGMYRVPDGQGVSLDGLGLNSPMPTIPRATPNRFGMTRMSPGMYKDAEGKIVKSKVGAPTQKKVFDPKRPRD